MSYLTAAKEYYKKQYPDEDLTPIGASEEELRALENSMGFRLPAAHREFLLWMGKDYDGIFYEGHWFIDEVQEMTEELRELLNENGLPLPSGKHVVCYNHGGYCAGWYLLPAKEDPDMYFFIEGHDKQPYLWGTIFRMGASHASKHPSRHHTVS